jgi:HPt (histidine-containing phosphotransfer) domain-containing protein
VLLVDDQTINCELAESPRVGPDEPAKLSIFDLNSFERTAAFLQPEVVAVYMVMLGARSEALLSGLSAPDAFTANAVALGTSAHALAGSAGMFGFARLASEARHFERAIQTSTVQTAAVELSVFGRALSATIMASIQEMHQRARTGN